MSEAQLTAGELTSPGLPTWDRPCRGGNWPFPRARLSRQATLLRPPGRPGPRKLLGKKGAFPGRRKGRALRPRLQEAEAPGASRLRSAAMSSALGLPGSGPAGRGVPRARAPPPCWAAPGSCRSWREALRCGGGSVAFGTGKQCEDLAVSCLRSRRWAGPAAAAAAAAFVLSR